MPKFLCVAAIVVIAAGPAMAGPRPKRDSTDGTTGASRVEPAQSAALFVGVRTFTHDATLTEVPYAVDDAVDLAHALAIEHKERFVRPQQVILALSGDPQKAQSQKHLQALLAAGARVQPAGQSDILRALDEQSRAAGRNGLLIVAFATHGVSAEGNQYLLTQTSILAHRETSIAETKVREIASETQAARSLILLDACRKKLTTGTRDGDADPRSAASLLRALADIHGQVVFSAASAGEYAYDDEVRRNGVFTAAVIDGLQCQAKTDTQGFVTVDTLSDFVETRVLSWVQKHRDPKVRRATQLACEGRSKLMPLARCR